LFAKSGCKGAKPVSICKNTFYQPCPGCFLFPGNDSPTAVKEVHGIVVINMICCVRIAASITNRGGGGYMVSHRLYSFFNENAM
jgi:hypothetical protein